MPTDFQNQTKMTPQELNAMVFPNEISDVVGTTATLLTRPAGARMITLMAVKGSWNVREGNRVSAGMPTAFAVTSASTAGEAGYPVHEKDRITIQAPELLTVKGYAGTDVLSYFWQ